MKNTVTIQDLANHLGMSRNTVSKALNGKPVPNKTRNAVISAAIEMGYKGYKLAAASENSSLGQKRFLILSSRLLMNINYYIYVLRGIEEALTDYNIELVQFSIANSSSFSKLKNYLGDNKVDGIICIEFFEEEYINELVDLTIPLVFLDFPFTQHPVHGHYDIILPESQEAIRNYCTHLIQYENCKTFGFVGDYRHCRSFYERYTGMIEALFLAGLDITPEHSILHDDAMSYSSELLSEMIQAMPTLPDCFFAANDTIALNLIAALKMNKINVPRNIKVVGFDNISDAKSSIPPLTTFNVNKTALGKQITGILLDRVVNPKLANCTIHIDSKLIIRSTT